MIRNGVVKELLIQIVSVNTQVTISARVSRFKQEGARGGGDDRPTHGVGIGLGYGLRLTEKDEHVMRGKEPGQHIRRIDRVQTGSRL